MFIFLCQAVFDSFVVLLKCPITEMRDILYLSFYLYEYFFLTFSALQNVKNPQFYKIIQ